MNLLIGYSFIKSKINKMIENTDKNDTMSHYDINLQSLSFRLKKKILPRVNVGYLIDL